MRTLAQIDLEIRKVENKRKLAKERILHYWKELEALNEERRKVMEGEHSQQAAGSENGKERCS